MKNEFSLFGTDGIRGNASKYPFDEETLFQIGKAAVNFFKAKKIFISGDTRRSTPEIINHIIKGIISQNCDVVFTEIMPTPLISYFTQYTESDCGIVISASHNPWNENGIKFFSKLGEKLNEKQEEEMEEYIFSKTFAEKEKGNISKMENWQSLAEKRFQDLFQFTSDKKIVLDCGHGATSLIAKNIFEKFYKNVLTINCEPNGYNINDGGSTDLKDLRYAVISNNAELGIAFDGDGDRVILMDEKGNEIDGDHIIAIIASNIEDKQIVVTPYSNLGLINYLEKTGKAPIITKNGDRYVYHKMKELNLQLGGEKTGHILLPNYSRTGDGMVSALKVLEILTEKDCKLSELNPFKDTPQVLINKEVAIKTPLKDLPEVEHKINEIQTILGKEGRVFVRYSGTQNLIRVMIEGPEENIIKEYATQILDLFR